MSDPETWSTSQPARMPGRRLPTATSAKSRRWGRRRWGVFTALLGSLLFAESAFPQAAQLTTVDSAGTVGQHTSIVIGADGLGLVAYYDATNLDLKVAHCSNVACSTATISTLDSTGDVGQFTSIAKAADGLGLISYYDATNQTLRVAHCSNAVCSSATKNTLGSAAGMSGTSIAIGSDGLGLIAFASPLKVAHCADTPCTTAVINTTTSLGTGPSLAIGSDGLGLVSGGVQGGSSNAGGYLTHCSDLPCATSSTSRLDDLHGGGMRDTAVVVGPGPFPRVFWSLEFIPELATYQCADLGCTSATLARESLFLGKRRAEYLDVRLGPDGLALVAFEGRESRPGAPLELRVVHCSDAGCTSGDISIVDTAGTAGARMFPSLSIGSDGFGLIAYHDSTNRDLKVAHCRDAQCSGVETSIGDVSVTISGPASGVLSFPVSLSPASPEPITVDFATEDGSALAPVDYQTANGTLTFLPGETAKSVDVLVSGRATPSTTDPTFTVKLSNPSAGFVRRQAAVGTIQVRIPAFSVASGSVQRGTSGTTLLRVPVTLSPTLTQPATVRASTVSGGSATSDVDYLPTSTVLTFAPGETLKYLEVPVIGHPWGGPDETVAVKLTEPSGGPILRDSATALISRNNLTIPTIVFSDITIAEGNEGATPLVFTLSLSPSSGEPVTVAFHTEDGTAIAGPDYEATSGTVVFSPGALTRTVRVLVKGNTTIQSNRFFSFVLGSATNAAVAQTSRTGSIQDDDLALSFRADPTLVRPGGVSILSWSAPGGAVLTLDGQAVSGPGGIQEVAPTSTRTYTLQAVLSGGTASKKVTINLDSGSDPLASPVVTAPLSGTTVLVSGVSLSWTEIAGAVGYELLVLDAKNGNTVFSGSLSGQGSTSTLASLPDGDFLFAARACSRLAAPGVSALCGRFGTAPFNVALVAPTDRPSITVPLRGATFFQSTQTFSWTTVTRDPRLPDLFYEVFLEDSAAGSAVLQITVPHPTASTVFTLGSSTEYRLRVRACQSACGMWSDPVTFAMTVPPAPTAPPMIGSCAVSGGNSVTCDWSAVLNAEAYQVQVVQPPPAGPGGGALTVAARQISTTAVTLKVPAGAATVFISGCNGNGCGPFATKEITVPGPNPAEPNLGTPMAGTVVDGPGVFFTWNRIPLDNGSNTTYRLFVQDLSRQATALDVRTQANYYAAYFKAEGARFDAQVVANPGLSNEVLGPAQGFNVAGASATAPTMVAPQHNSTVRAGNVLLGWSPVPGASLYEYFVGLPGGTRGTAQGVTSGLFARVPLTGVGLGSVYNGVVRACPSGAACLQGSDAGWGPWSNVAGPGVTSFTVVP